MERCSCFEEIVRALGVRDLAGIVHGYSHGGARLPLRLTRQDAHGNRVPRNCSVICHREYPEDGWAQQMYERYCRLNADEICIAIFFRYYILDTGPEYEVNVNVMAGWGGDAYNRAFFVSNMFDHGNALLAALRDRDRMRADLELDETWDAMLHYGVDQLLRMCKKEANDKPLEDPAVGLDSA
jgi:hypothetical protein